MSPRLAMLSAPTMTAQRQERYGLRRQMAVIALLASFFSVLRPDFAAQAATTERIVVNRYSGLAIAGFDPVAYFTDSMAVQGLPDYEAREGGAVWRFRNEGNRASFVAHPEIYGPQATTLSISGAASRWPATRASGWSQGSGSICSAARKTAMRSPRIRSVSSRKPPPAGLPSSVDWRSKRSGLQTAFKTPPSDRPTR